MGKKRNAVRPQFFHEASFSLRVKTKQESMLTVISGNPMHMLPQLLNLASYQYPTNQLEITNLPSLFSYQIKLPLST